MLKKINTEICTELLLFGTVILFSCASVIGNGVVSHAFLENHTFWRFLRPQIAVNVEVHAIFKVFEKLTHACVFQIAHETMLYYLYNLPLKSLN